MSRGSRTGPGRPRCACRGVVRGAGRVGIRVGYTGVLPSRQAPHAKGGPDSEAGPGRPRGPGVGGQEEPSPYVRTHPSGARSVHPWPSLVLLEQMPASGPIRRELTSFLINLVKTPECHRNMSKRPAVVPISKTAPKVSSSKTEISILASLLSQGINRVVLTRHVSLLSK